MAEQHVRRQSTARQVRQQKKRFLEHFAVYGNVLRAAQAARVQRTQIYRWLEDDEEFTTAYRFAELEATEVLEFEARRRAVDGVDKQRRVYDSRGNLIDEYTETSYSDTLLIFLLKARAPEKYRDRYQVEHTGSLQVTEELDDVISRRLEELAASGESETALALAGESETTDPDG